MGSLKNRDRDELHARLLYLLKLTLCAIWRIAMSMSVCTCVRLSPMASLEAQIWSLEVRLCIGMLCLMHVAIS